MSVFEEATVNLKDKVTVPWLKVGTKIHTVKIGFIFLEIRLRFGLKMRERDITRKQQSGQTRHSQVLY